MYPVAPLLFRTVANAFEFGGCRIPAGEHVIIATTVPHYLPECFPDRPGTNATWAAFVALHSVATNGKVV